MGVRRYVVEFWHVGNDNWKEIVFDAGRMMRDKLNALRAQKGAEQL